MMNRNRELVPGSWSLVIIILEICKCPTYQNILTSQGTCKSKNSDGMLQHTIFFNKIHFHFIAHTHTHTHTHTHIERKNSRLKIKIKVLQDDARFHRQLSVQHAVTVWKVHTSLRKTGFIGSFRHFGAIIHFSTKSFP